MGVNIEHIKWTKIQEGSIENAYGWWNSYTEEEKDFTSWYLNQGIQDFLGTKKSTNLFCQELQEAFEAFEALLKERWIVLKDDLVYDHRIKAAWLGLMRSNSNYYNEYSSNESTDIIVDLIRTKYNNTNLDLPIKKELTKSLTQLTSAPFSICEKRPNINSYFLYKTNDGQVQSYDTDYKYLSDASSHKGLAVPLIRLKEEDDFELTDKEVFLCFLHHRFVPTSLENETYTKLISSELKISPEYEVSSSSLKKRYASIATDSIADELRAKDTFRCNLKAYDRKLLKDINKGSWEAFAIAANEESEEAVKLGEPMVGQDPVEAINEGGIIGIDFGTKSTVVVYQKGSEDILPLRVGIGDIDKAIAAHHYENPTVVEFIDLNTFLQAYQEPIFRPETKWNDLTISHTAYENLKNAKSEDFNAYLMELKQWAGDKNRKLKIKDQKRKIFDLEPFLELSEDSLNPIELYAYYLGLYINNQYNGIFLEYLLSFPVTYEKKVREQILNSFKKGLMKSLPNIGNRIEDFKITAGVSEPAAYAAVALQEYGLVEENERNFYAIFDFGGGTTDFDFGIFRYADEENRKESRYDYVIEHFGAGGDQFLGGENLLEKLAFYIFKKNADLLREKNISFELVPQEKPFLGSEVLLSDSREARLNMVSLATVLRPFWEREIFEENVFEDGLKVDLYNNDGIKQAKVELEVDELELLAILEYRIKVGVDNFFESLTSAFNSYMNEVKLDDVELINIFLAGNSSKSPIVKNLFENKIEELKKDLDSQNIQADFQLYDPLDNRDNFEKPNGKTGVAFGLIESREGGSILVVDKNTGDDSEIKFKYYLGKNKRKRFNTVIDRDVAYGKWVRFIDAGYESFEVYYTSAPMAVTNNLSLHDQQVKKLRCSIPHNKIDENKDIYIRLVSPTEFEYGVGDSHNENIVTLEKVDLVKQGA